MFGSASVRSQRRQTTVGGMPPLDRNDSGTSLPLGMLLLWAFCCVVGHQPVFAQHGNSVTFQELADEQDDAKGTGQDSREDDKLVVWTAEDSSQDSRWEFKDPAGWRFTQVDELRVLSQFQKASAYKPPHRSPLHIALLKDEVFESFQLDCWVKSTHPEYGHRDVCFFFGYAAPDRFYYVHLASEMDNHANQIFIVDKADRVKISQTTTNGTRWDDDWHHVRIQRDLATEKISVYFDDLEKPIMTAVSSAIGAGQVGFGSFDDTADFKRLEIRRK